MEEKEEKEQQIEIIPTIKKEIEKILKEINEQGIQQSNIDDLGKIIDIHKDICNEEYWKIKEENYMYGEYGDSYGTRGVKGTGRYSRYRDGGSYGRRSRDSRGRYRGEDMLDDMYEGYGRYSEGRDEYNRGNYGAKEDTMKSLEYMLESVACFVDMLKDEASPEEMQIIKQYTRKISEM